MTAQETLKLIMDMIDALDASVKRNPPKAVDDVLTAIYQACEDALDEERSRT